MSNNKKQDKILKSEIVNEIRRRMKNVERKKDYFDGGKHSALYSLLNWVLEK